MGYANVRARQRFVLVRESAVPGYEGIPVARHCTREQLLQAARIINFPQLINPSFRKEMIKYAADESDSGPDRTQIGAELVSAIAEKNAYTSSDINCRELFAVLSSRLAVLRLYVLLFDDELEAETRQHIRHHVLPSALIAYTADTVDLAEIIDATGEGVRQNLHDAFVPKVSLPDPGTIWSAVGQGDIEVSVRILFRPGTYSFNLNRPALEDNWGSIYLDDVVAVVPEDWPLDSEVRFPARMQIRNMCFMSAMLKPIIFSGYESEIWEVSVTKLD